MKAVGILLLLSSLIGAAPTAAAWTESYTDAASLFVFDGPQPQQAHPKTAVVAVPILDEPMGGYAPLFLASYITRFGGTQQDPRNGKGSVTMRIEVLRSDQVVWEKSIKDRIKSDWNTTWECGNCTHKLDTCYDGTLQRGDVVLFEFAFKQLPAFNQGESSYLGVELLSRAEECAP